ncbi:hypothetical protein F4778DRAFT_276246 [Xylariomycetidae sp. FL2044]|nr:hypothetical protein F4778DRAFT_276246 [Xylariomycetidae sp. FL2044]
MWSFGTTMTIAKDSDPPAEPAKTKAPAKGPPSPPPASTTNISQPNEIRTRPSTTSERSLRQLGFFFAGAGFLSLSILVTRRAIARKRISTIPKFFIPSNSPIKKSDSDNALIAVEALGYATLNTMGFGIMTTGGLAWAFDISNLDDLKAKARRSMYNSGGTRDEAGEREIEEWVTKVLLQKDNKEQEANERSDK